MHYNYQECNTYSNPFTNNGLYQQCCFPPSKKKKKCCFPLVKYYVVASKIRIVRDASIQSFSLNSST